MLDNNWELINGPVAHQIEVLNATNQSNVLDGLIAFLLAHKGPSNLGNPRMPDEAALLTLHHAGTLFLLAHPGRYRDIEVSVGIQNGPTFHKPPPWQAVPGLMQGFFRHLSSVWTSGDALDAAAYALWAINWIHPFRNGNGRTARAFSYACLTLKLGVVLPGAPTVIDQIMQDRPGYEGALRWADSTFAVTKIPDLDKMRTFLEALLNKQIMSIAPVAVVPVPPTTP